MTPRIGHLPALSARWSALAVVAGLALAAGCSSSADPDRPRHPGDFRLVSYESCDQAAEELRAAALAYVTPWGLAGDGAASGPGFAADDSVGAAEAAGPVAAPGAARLEEQTSQPGPADVDPSAPDHSGTNVHEAGVDEPDLVKTDGRRIITVQEGTLRVVDAAQRAETGSLDLFPEARPDDPGRWAVADLILAGDRALVLLNESYAWYGPADGAESTRPAPAIVDPEEPVEDIAEPGQRVEPDQPVAPDDQPPDELLPVEPPIVGPRLLLVDLSGAPTLLSEYTVDGGLVDARAVGATARVVVRSAPRLDLPALDGITDTAERLAWTRAALDATELSDWLPRYESTVDGGGVTGQVDCTTVTHPAEYSGTSMLTVLTFDLTEADLGDGTPVTVVADGETVYSNGENLYIANDQRWRAGPMPMFPGDAEESAVPEVDDRTEIHKFDLSEPGPPRYVGSGAVEGWLINQYAMSEWDGHLRVATTSGETWWGGDQSETESTVFVLAERDGALAEVGSVGGLGAGERIYAVRFAGPVGYVVTFRQTDPLYTVDLSDPTDPVVLGELKITGYSAYLHPIGDGRLLGIGQEADLAGITQGTQASLFDVSDLSDPQLLAAHHVRYGHSEAEFDPHAFLWWAPERMLVVPLSDHEGNSGALVLRVADDEFTERGLITHPGGEQWDYRNAIRRSLVIEDTLWTLSEAGLAAHSLTTLDELAWLPF